MKKKMGRPKKNGPLKKRYSVRVYENEASELIEKFGAIQAALDFLVSSYLKKK